jgi:hypothetical protein
LLAAGVGADPSKKSGRSLRIVLISSLPDILHL